MGRQRERGREGGREGGRKGGREGGRERERTLIHEVVVLLRVRMVHVYT